METAALVRFLLEFMLFIAMEVLVLRFATVVTVAGSGWAVAVTIGTWYK